MSKLEQAEFFDAELEQIGMRHPSVIALSKDGAGIIWTESLSDTGQFPSLTQAAIAAYKSIGNELERFLASK